MSSIDLKHLPVSLNGGRQLAECRLEKEVQNLDGQTARSRILEAISLAEL
jgi:hypothetical protein